MKTSDLKLPVATLPEAGLVLEGELPQDWATAALLEAYQPRSGVSLRIEVLPVNDNVLAKGRATLRVAYECSRTLTPTETELKVEFAELYLPDDERHEINLGEGVDTEVLADEPWLIRGGEVDLNDLVREHLILAQDPYPVAPGVAPADPDSDDLIWSSSSDEVDSRWAKLKNLKLD